MSQQRHPNKNHQHPHPMKIDFAANRSAINLHLANYEGITKADMAKYAGNQAAFLADWELACDTADYAGHKGFEVIAAAKRLAEIIKSK